jgi:2-amino-4-hydroxy-6-hydroxymethyldihydropteridine diphosphokinase
MMHRAYLNVGSNIQPELNLPKAIQLLREHGQVTEISHAWESKSVGYDGPNFLNCCILFFTNLHPTELKEQIIRPIEAKLGRVRGENKNAPRTIDIDTVLFDEQPLNTEYWDYAFVAVPLAELIPDFEHPIRKEKMSHFSEQVQGQVWIVKRENINLQN